MWTATNLDDGTDWVMEAEDLRHRWEHIPGFEAAADVVVAEVAGEIVGFVTHDWRTRGPRVFHAVQPVVPPGRAPPRPRPGAPRLGGAARGRGGRRGNDGQAARAAPPRAWADLEVAAAAPFAASAGYRVDGYGVLMARSLAEPIPDAPLPASLSFGRSGRPTIAASGRPTRRRSATTATRPTARRSTSSAGSRCPSSTPPCGMSPGTATRSPAPRGTSCSRQRTSASGYGAGSSSTSRSGGRGGDRGLGDRPHRAIPRDVPRPRPGRGRVWAPTPRT